MLVNPLTWGLKATDHRYLVAWSDAGNLKVLRKPMSCSCSDNARQDRKFV